MPLPPSPFNRGVHEQRPDLARFTRPNTGSIPLPSQESVITREEQGEQVEYYDENTSQYVDSLISDTETSPEYDQNEEFFPDEYIPEPETVQIPNYTTPDISNALLEDTKEEHTLPTPRSQRPISPPANGTRLNDLIKSQATPQPAAVIGIEEENDPFVNDIELAESTEKFFQALNDDDYTEIIMNGPNEILGKKNGVRYHFSDIRFNTTKLYHQFINEKLLPYTDEVRKITDKAFLLEGQLTLDAPQDGVPPLFARVHIIAPPVVRTAKVTIAKKSRYSLTIDDFVTNGTLTRNMGEVMKALARGRATIVFSGLSGSGKTTFLQAMSHYFDPNDRVIIVEDTPELRLPLGGALPLFATTRRPGQPKDEEITIEWLVAATNRMRPDRIIVGELRGAEANEFLIAANSGADGSMTTIHAGDPRRALDKLLGLSLKADGVKNEKSIARDIANTVQFIVQLGEIDGKHLVTRVEEIGDVVNERNNGITSNTIFVYDEERGTHRAQGRLSDKMVAFLKQRDIKVDNSWFSS